ncbi:ASCH domain-containing protein [Rhodanobacter sp. C03]|uniref:ASCH domain-containing protein n=1 Tax=Rhodanobacter sp. C03 TaxID=1945858 RepID=UPI00098623AA|nr:ASCH domain-containing protein [Rhodanobacter sp. C03]OOG60065.1 hypothetical protein B0E48_04700 [Rhodanobacter sp. C03]
MDVQKGLIIRQPWIDLILSGEKTWEMRSNRASHRGSFGLILRGSKTVIGVADLVKVHGPLTVEQLEQSFVRHRASLSVLNNAGGKPWSCAWELANVRRLPRPVPYAHKSEVRWVEFSAAVVEEIQTQLSTLYA